MRATLHTEAGLLSVLEPLRLADAQMITGGLEGGGVAVFIRRVRDYENNVDDGFGGESRHGGGANVFQPLRAWPQGADALTRTPDEAAALGEAGGTLSLQDWTRVFQILAGLEFGLKASSQPRFLFEGALIRMAGLSAVRPIEEVLASLGGTPPARLPPPKLGAAAAVRAPAPSKPSSESGHAARPSPVATGFDDVRDAIVASVSAVRPMLGALLQRATAIVVDGGTLLVSFGPSDGGMRRMLLGDDNVRSVEGVASKTLGRPLTLRVTESSEGIAPGSAGTDPGPDPPPNAAAQLRDGAAESRQALNERARNDPAVSRLLTEFGAQVVDVRALRPDVEENG